MSRRHTGDGPHPIDVHVGHRLRLRRVLLGLSQQRLANCLGLSFQQVQKYEKGTNRVAAGRLHELAQILDVPVGFFFEDPPTFSEKVPAPDVRHDPLSGSVRAENGPGLDPGFDPKRETLELVRAYYRIRQPGVRKKLLELIRDLGNKDTGKPADLPHPTVSTKHR